jgi:hypothetical protein
MVSSSSKYAGIQSLEYDQDLMQQFSGGSSQMIMTKQSTNMQFGGNDRYNTSYHIEFHLNYKAEPGVQICLFGKIPELSMWDKENPKAWLKRGADDVWVLEKPLVTNQFFFTYKFALFDKNRKFMNFERGIDRICDAELKEAAESKFGREYYDHRSGKNHQTEPVKDNVKRIEMNMGWETMKVTFSVSYPIDDPNDGMTLLGS